MVSRPGRWSPPERLIAETARHRGVIGEALPDGLREAAAPYLEGVVPVPPPYSAATTAALVVSHADLEGEHIFVSPAGAEVTGIIDWSDAALCEPQVDLQNLQIWLGTGFLRQLLAHYAGTGHGGDGRAIDERLFERAVAYRRYECLRELGVRLLGQSDDPLDLLITQLRWACTDG